MSELKAYRIKGNTLGDFDDVYIKSEADKVIAELEEKLDGQKWRGDEWARACNQKDKEIERLKAIRKIHVEAIESMEAGLLQNDEEIRRHKYKRCLAMAKWCFTKSNYHFVLARHG